MAHFSESLCELVIKSEGGCGLSRNEMTQMARFALRAIRNENPWMMDGIRYRFLRDGDGFEKIGLFIGQQTGAGFSRWTGEHADMIVNAAMQGEGGEANQRSDAAHGGEKNG